MAASLAFYEPQQPAHSVVDGAPLELMLIVVSCIARMGWPGTQQSVHAWMSLLCRHTHKQSKLCRMRQRLLQLACLSSAVSGQGAKYQILLRDTSAGRLQVCQAKALLAEALRLGDELPPALVPGHPAGARFAPVAFNFGYFKEAEVAERRMEASRELSALDEELREARKGDLYTLAVIGLPGYMSSSAWRPAASCPRLELRKARLRGLSLLIARFLGKHDGPLTGVRFVQSRPEVVPPRERRPPGGACRRAADCPRWLWSCGRLAARARLVDRVKERYVYDG